MIKLEKVKKDRNQIAREKIRAKQQEDLNFRTNFLKLFMQVAGLQKQQELTGKGIIRRKAQLNSEVIEKDQWNNKKSKEQLEDEISLQEFKLKDLELALTSAKESLIEFIKPKTIKEVLAEVQKHNKKIEEEYERQKP